MHIFKETIRMFHPDRYGSYELSVMSYNDLFKLFAEAVHASTGKHVTKCRFSSSKNIFGRYRLQATVVYDSVNYTYSCTLEDYNSLANPVIYIMNTKNLLRHRLYNTICKIGR